MSKLAYGAVAVLLVTWAPAQNQTALPTPAMTGPLQQLPPAVFDAGPLGS